jgi:S-adenosylmethionine hydrolase
VLWVDRFGNIQLNVDPDEVEHLGDRVGVRWGDKGFRVARRASAYGALKGGEAGLIVDSYGLLSVAFDRRSAADELGLAPGDAVALEPPA